MRVYMSIYGTVIHLVILWADKVLDISIFLMRRICKNSKLLLMFTEA